MAETARAGKTQTKKQRLNALKLRLKKERLSFEPTWMDCSDFILPTRARFYTSDVNKGDRRNQKIINSTATQAVNVLSSGIVSGATNPASPWFRLEVPYPELAEVGSVKRWLFDVTNIMSTSFLKSNLYKVLPIVYSDMAVFATAAMLMEEDFTGKVCKFKSIPVGSYMIAQNADGKVDTFCREFKYTVQQIVDVFGKKDEKTGAIDWSNISDTVKRMYEDDQTQEWIEITHIIQPNNNYDAEKYESKYKKYYQCYYESAASDEVGPTDDGGEKYLSEQGYDYFPVLAPRWKVTGEDVYGTSCPAFDALGDIKQLQLGEKRVLEAIEKLIDPPMVGPSTLKGKDGKLTAGSYHAADSRDGKAAVYPAYQIQFDVQSMESKNQQVEARINNAFYKNLFISFADTERKSGTTKAEVDAVRSEQLLALGPVWEQISQDVLNDLIENSFMFHLKQGMLPEPPPELQGVALKVEYLSTMAQALKSVGVSTIERFVAFIGNTMAIDPQVIDKLNTDQAADIYADAMSVPPAMVRTDDEVAQIRQVKAEQQKAANDLAMLQQGATAAKDLSQAKMGGEEESALDRVVEKV